MRSLIACGIAAILILLSAKISPALAIMVAISADIMGFDGGAILTLLWH